MTAQGLAFISSSLDDAGINYSFQEWSGNIVYPYFVGDYIESSCDGEKGETQSRFILTGTANGSWLSLETQKEKIREIFPETGKTVIFPDGNGMAVIYSDAVCVPTGTAEFKRIQINFIVKEWRVN